MKNKVLAVVLFAAGFSLHPLAKWSWETPEARAGESVCAELNCDSNGDGRRDLSDPIHTLQWLFVGGPEPVPPCASAGDLEALRNALEQCRLDLAEARRRLNECCPTPGEVCNNATDDDVDALIDCDDSDCATSPACAGPAEVCDNGIDDDGDADIDCADSDCGGRDECSEREVCDNGTDDDADGTVDCADSDCASFPGCAPPGEVCNNGVDDDGDGLIDCGDSDCAAGPECSGSVEVCDNLRDDDGDADIDCADSDCTSSPECTGR